jgi:glycine hydroxymethyltransferase
MTSGIKKILVVCTGNMCRSPMAEGFLKKELSREDGYEIISAGISAISGMAPTAEAVQAMREENIDISLYQSKPLSNELVKQADIILVMSGMHKDFIIKTMPDSESKVFLLNGFSGLCEELSSIPDPVGQPLEVYRKVRDQIKMASKAVLNKIKQ